MEISEISEDEFEKLELNAGVLIGDKGVLTFEPNENFGSAEEVGAEMVDGFSKGLQNPIEIPKLSETEVLALRESLRQVYLQEDGRVKMSCVCDSTLLFLAEMVWTLDAAGCTDIQTESRPATESEIPQEKPFCSWYYAASGILPE